MAIYSHPPDKEQLAGYIWPPSPAGTPVWKEGSFSLENGKRVSVVPYDEKESHWSEDLTTVHETEAGNGDHPIDRASRRLALNTLRQHAPAGIVLDVGCSSGFFLRDLRQEFPDTPAIGADYIGGPLRKIASTLPGVPLLQFDLRTCPLPPDRLAAVVCLNVLEHIDRDEQALGHIHRILQPGGIAHIEVPASPSCYDIYDEYLMHHRRYTMRELTTKARRAGFEIVSRTHLGASVFPVFYAVKQRNRRYLKLPATEKQAKVHQMMRSTRRSLFLEQAIRFELVLGKWIPYPVGIRCVVVLKKQ